LAKLGGTHVSVEQLGHQPLSQPDRLTLAAYLNSLAAVLNGEDEKFSCRTANKATRRKIEGIE